MANTVKSLLIIILTLLIVVLGALTALLYIDGNISVENLAVTNITDSAFTLVWTSEDPYIGRVVYQEGGETWLPIIGQLGKQVAFDDRDVELTSEGEYVLRTGNGVPRYTHHVTVRNLKPETQYEFRIAGVLNGKASDIRSAQTLQLKEDLQTPDPAYGSIEGITSGLTTQDIIVSITIENRDSGVLSTVLSENSTYSIDLNNFLTEFTGEDNLYTTIFQKDAIVRETLNLENYKPLDTIQINLAASDQVNNPTEIGLNFLEGITSTILANECNGRVVDSCRCGENQISCITDEAKFAAEGYSCAAARNNGYLQCIPQDNGKNDEEDEDKEVNNDQGQTSTNDIDDTLPLDPLNDRAPTIVTEYNDKQRGDRCVAGQSLPQNGGCDGSGPLLCINCDRGSYCGLSVADCPAEPENLDLTADSTQVDSIETAVIPPSQSQESAMSEEQQGLRGPRSTNVNDSNPNATEEVSTYYLCGKDGVLQLQLTKSQYLARSTREEIQQDSEIACTIDTAVTSENTRDTRTTENTFPSENNRDIPILQDSDNQNQDVFQIPYQDLENSALLDVSAQDTPRSQGSVLQATEEGVAVDDSGRYAFFADGNRIAERDVIADDGSVTLRLFEDTNGNGVRDDGETYFEDYSQISIAKEASLETFDLVAGWNLIHLPMVDTREEGGIKSAGDLIDSWNDQEADIVHVARFRNGQFQMFSKRETGDEFSPDFDLIPGEALFVLNRTPDSSVRFTGNIFEDSVPVQLVNGWNMVGLVSPGSNLDSEQVLGNLTTAGFTVSTLSQFENGRYQSVVQDELNGQNQIFGNNFNIVDKRGYFIKIEDGGGQTFTP